MTDVTRVKKVIQAEVLFQEGQKLMEQDKLDEAREKFQAAYDLNPELEYLEHVRMATQH